MGLQEIAWPGHNGFPKNTKKSMQRFIMEKMDYCALLKASIIMHSLFCTRGSRCNSTTNSCKKNKLNAKKEVRLGLIFF